MKRYIVKPEDLIDDLEGIPIEIAQKMVDYQVKQGNKPNIKIFQNNLFRTKANGGFDWYSTKEGEDYWVEILSDRAFISSFKYYPKIK